VNLLRKGLILAGLEALLALSVTGKLYYDRATRPRVWVRTMPWDPSLPIRGRYLALRLVPERGAPYFDETNSMRANFFVPEHTTELEKTSRGLGAPEVWAEVTIPRKGPPRPIRLGLPRPIRLGLKRDGTIEPVQVN
jgi:hypothetical protein